MALEHSFRLQGSCCPRRVTSETACLDSSKLPETPSELSKLRLPTLPAPRVVRGSSRLLPTQLAPRALKGDQRRKTFAVSSALLDSSSSSSSVSSIQPDTNSWFQKFIELPSFRRGCHIITRYIHKAVPEIGEYSVGLAHIFVMHTSCSLTINENASPDVPLDMEDALNRIAPEGDHYRHLDEGYDDMPAHVKASLMGSSLTVPISQGRLALGTWQGIWLNEHRDYGGSRRLVITLQGARNMK